MVTNQSQNESFKDEESFNVTELEKRKRKPFVLPKGTPAIIDDMEFKRNFSTERARHIIKSFDKIIIDLHFDQHYMQRFQHGEDDGTERKGIDPAAIQALVLKSISHLIYYSCVVKSFSFVNIIQSATKTEKIRIVIKEEKDGQILNTVIQVHGISLVHYEATVITAMCGENFKTSIGQYVLEIQQDESILYINVNKTLNKVCEY